MRKYLPSLIFGFISGLLVFWIPTVTTGNLGIPGASFVMGFIPNNSLGLYLFGIPDSLMVAVVLVLMYEIICFIRKEKTGSLSVFFVALSFFFGSYLAFLISLSVVLVGFSHS